MSSTTDKKDTPDKKPISSRKELMGGNKERIPISQQYFRTFDQLRKMSRDTDWIHLMTELEFRSISNGCLVRLMGYYNEVYACGLIMGDRYIKQVEEIDLLKLKIAELEIKVKNYEEFNGI